MSTGAELRDQGFEQLGFAINGAGDSWYENAWRYIEALPRGNAFTADLLRSVVGDPPRPSAMGMLVRRAAKDDLLREVGYQPSERTERRAGSLRTWVRT